MLYANACWKNSLRGQKWLKNMSIFGVFFTDFFENRFFVDFSRNFIENYRKTLVFNENHRKTWFSPRSELKNACVCSRIAPQAKILGNIRKKLKFSRKNLSIFLVLSAGGLFFCLSLGGIVTTYFGFTWPKKLPFFLGWIVTSRGIV